MSAISSILFFFFSSRRRHTRFDCDWSSDVCSSDLSASIVPATRTGVVAGTIDADGCTTGAWPAYWITLALAVTVPPIVRSEERRVGKECSSGGSPEQQRAKIEGIVGGTR